MKLLLHICCAPCSIMCIETLRGEGIEPVGFWDNPNIHPFTEFRMRRNTLVDYAKEIGLSLVVEGGCGLRFLIPLPEYCGGGKDRCGGGSGGETARTGLYHEAYVRNRNLGIS